MTYDEQLIYAFALRYAIGRQTYAPRIVISEVRSHINDFSKNTLKTMFSDIQQYEEEQELLGRRSEYIWTNLKNFLSERLNK